MKIIQGQTIENVVCVKESGQDYLVIKNSTLRVMAQPVGSLTGSVGVDARACQLVDIENSVIEGVGLSAQKYAYGMRLGFTGEAGSHNVLTRIKGSTIKGFGPPHAGYDLNRDCISAEGGDGEVWILDSKFEDCSDGILDIKLARAFVKASADAAFLMGDAYRPFRCWPTCTLVLIGLPIKRGLAGYHVWMGGLTSRVFFYNCVDAETGGPIEFSGEDMTPAVARSLAIQVYKDPTASEPWFGPALPDLPAPPVEQPVAIPNVTGIKTGETIGVDTVVTLNHPNIKKVKFYLDGTSVGSDYDSPFVYTIPAASMPQTPHILSCDVTHVDNSLESVTISFKVGSSAAVPVPPFPCIPPPPVDWEAVYNAEHAVVLNLTTQNASLQAKIDAAKAELE